MTIDVGYAHLALPDGRSMDFVDVPGHDRLVGNMLVGAGEIDAAMLVVAADDGPRAQTLEHLELLDALGIGFGLAVVTKVDLVDAGRVDDVVARVAELLEGTSLAASPIVAVSAAEPAGLPALRSAVRDLDVRVRASSPASDDEAARPMRLAIDRTFAVKGRGAVVTGTLRGGAVVRGRTLWLVPGDRPVRVRDIQVHGSAVDAAGSGRTALNIAGLDLADLTRGLVLTDDPAVVATDRLLVRLARAWPDRSRARVHLGTAAVDGVVGRSGRDAIELPDGSSAAVVRLASPVAAAAGDRFVLRRATGPERIVGGVVLDVTPPRGISRRRQTPERVVELAAVVGAIVGSASSNPEPSTPAEDYFTARLDLHGALPVPGGTRLAPDVAAAVDGAILQAVEAAGPDGLSLTATRAAAGRALRRATSVDRARASDAAAAAVERLATDGRIVRDGAIVRSPGSLARPTPDADPELVAAMDRLEALLDVAAPPALADAARASGCPPAGIRALERSARIVLLEPDLAYAMRAYRDLTAQALAMAARAPVTPAAYRDATGTSRKYVIAILSDLDRRGILQRTLAGHVPGPRAPRAAAASPARSEK